MAKYMVFIYNDEALLNGADADTIQSILAGHEKFRASHGGSIRGGGRLAPSVGSVTIRAGDGDAPLAAQSGPFLLDTAERVSGYYIIEADSIDQAAQIASDVPALGGVEVRQLV
jgi:hypothetical protein